MRVAEVLAVEVSGSSRAELLVGLDTVVPAEQELRFFSLAERVGAGEPLQHVLGHWSFRTLELAVDERALIPRPETEVVVEIALRELERKKGACGDQIACDLGTGSGAIACALVTENARVRVHGVDRSPEALALARVNRSRLADSMAARVHLHEGDFYEALPRELAGSIDLVVSNPPYVSEAEWVDLEATVRDFDPRQALVSGPTGLEAIATVLKGAAGQLKGGGSLVCEIAPWQKDASVTLALDAGAATAHVESDLAQRPRVLVARY